MQENDLEENQEADLEVYVVWEPMLGVRRRDAVEATGPLTDRQLFEFGQALLGCLGQNRQANLGNQCILKQTL